MDEMAASGLAGFALREPLPQIVGELQKKRALDEGPSGLPLVVNDQSKYLRSVTPQVRGWLG